MIFRAIHAHQNGLMHHKYVGMYERASQKKDKRKEALYGKEWDVNAAWPHGGKSCAYENMENLTYAVGIDHQYCVWSPLAALRTSHRCGMLVIRAIMRSVGISSHCSRGALRRSAIIHGGNCTHWTNAPRHIHTWECSISSLYHRTVTLPPSKMYSDSVASIEYFASLLEYTSIQVPFCDVLRIVASSLFFPV